MPAVAVSKGRLITAAILAIFVYGMIAAMLGTLLPSFKLTPQQNSFLALLQANVGVAVVPDTLIRGTPLHRLRLPEWQLRPQWPLHRFLLFRS